MGTEELVTLQEFAERYRVDTETVRGWVRKGIIKYVITEGRKLIRIVDAVKPKEEEEDPIV